MRLTMVQVLINSKGLNMNPIQSLYYVSPACFICLFVPFRESPAAGAAGVQRSPACAATPAALRLCQPCLQGARGSPPLPPHPPPWRPSCCPAQ
jgi:hypothetical protein